MRPLLGSPELRRQSLTLLQFSSIVQRSDWHGCVCFFCSMVFLFAPVLLFFCFFARSVAVPSVVPNIQCVFNSTAPTRTAAVAVPMTIYEAVAALCMTCSIVLFGCC